ncbi:hypothetical protein B9Z55_011654 [Caenorhabditis nigoni]|uniref:Uncharacterized protein n=1 Tax=Caenorhabditis nigoni TaxID=1611254 RepID=A0A2G5UL57_9PELO|nr:hypothetical protein B9Z55_011654 [Caenorhabditis nigoni]
MAETCSQQSELDVRQFVSRLTDQQVVDVEKAIRERSRGRRRFSLLPIPVINMNCSPTRCGTGLVAIGGALASLAMFYSLPVEYKTASHLALFSFGAFTVGAIASYFPHLGSLFSTFAIWCATPFATWCDEKLIACGQFVRYEVKNSTIPEIWSSLASQGCFSLKSQSSQNIKIRLDCFLKSSFSYSRLRRAAVQPIPTLPLHHLSNRNTSLAPSARVASNPATMPPLRRLETLEIWEDLENAGQDQGESHSENGGRRSTAQPTESDENGTSSASEGQVGSTMKHQASSDDQGGRCDHGKNQGEGTSREGRVGKRECLTVSQAATLKFQKF